MNRPLTSAALKAATQPAALVGIYEHRLTAEVSPMVSLALTLPAGSKFSVNEQDCGQIAAAYKHALLQVTERELEIEDGNGTKDESKISLSRKADLRPSPISSILSSDLLTFRANFHLNYLSEIIATFKEIQKMELSEFEVERTIKPAVQLDGQLATCENVQLVLMEAANRLAFRRNSLYFPAKSDGNIINLENLNTFHSQTRERCRNNQQYSLLLSVNDSSMIDSRGFVDIVNSCDIPVLEGKELNCNQETPSLPTNPVSLMIESNESFETDYLIAFPVKSGGFAQKDSFKTLIFESLLKKYFPTTLASVTSDTALITIHFPFSADQSSTQIKAQLKETINAIRSLPDKVKDEDLIWAQNRAKFNQALAIDSRDNRLLTFAHHFAFLGKLPHPSADVSAKELRDNLRESVQQYRPIVIGKGNYKKLAFYDE